MKSGEMATRDMTTGQEDRESRNMKDSLIPTGHLHQPVDHHVLH